MESTPASLRRLSMSVVGVLAPALVACNAPDAGGSRDGMASTRASRERARDVESVELRVRCVSGEDGAPLPGAELFLLPPGRGGWLELLAARARGEDLESLARRAGTRVVCGSEGLWVARADAPPEPDGAKDWLPVIGIAEGSMALTELDATPYEQRLELHPIRTATVELLDAHGAPAAGLLAALRVYDEHGFPDDVITARTGAGGEAVLRFPADLLAAPRVAIAAVGLFAEPVEVPVDARGSSDAPFLLRLPPYGTVELATPGGRQPWAVAVEVDEADGQEPAELPPVPIVLENGHARIEPVAPGITLWVLGFDEDPAWHWFAAGPGPTEPRQSVRLELQRYETLPLDLVLPPLTTGERR